MATDKSLASSSDALLGRKHGREDSLEAGPASDLEYEAALCEKLEAEQASREQVERDRAAWAAGPAWLQREEQAREEEAAKAAAMDPWEVAMSGSSAATVIPRLVPPRGPADQVLAGGRAGGAGSGAAGLGHGVADGRGGGFGNASFPSKSRRTSPLEPGSSSMVASDGIPLPRLRYLRDLLPLALGVRPLVVALALVRLL